MDLKIAQFTEVLYTLGGVILSFFKVNFDDPVFWLGIIPTIIASPLTLVMNVSLVDPDSEVSDEICPENLRINHEYLAQTGKIKFINSVIDTKHLGFKNDFGAEYYLRYVGPLASREPDWVLPWYLAPLRWLTIAINDLTFMINNTVGPLGNWLAAGFVISLTNMSSIKKIITGGITFAPVLVTNCGYYVALGYQPVVKANNDTWSARNPIVQSFRIDWVAALKALIEYLNNAILRGLTISGCVAATLEYVDAQGLLSEELLADINHYATLMIFIAIALATAFTRHRAFGSILEACTFMMPYGQKVVITSPRVLNFGGIQDIVKAEFSAGDLVKLQKKAFLYGACYAGAAGILLAKKFDLIYAVPGTTATLFAFALLDYYASKGILIRKRARAVLDTLSGMIRESKASPELLRFVFWTVFFDAIIRAIGRIGGMRGIPFVQAVGLTNLKMFFAGLSYTIPAAIPEALFFMGLMMKNGPGIIKFVQNSTEDAKPGENNGCWRRTNRTLSKFLTWSMPCFFRKRPEPDPVPLNSINGPGAVPMIQGGTHSMTIYAQTNGERIKSTLRKVKEAEKNEMCLVM